MAIRRTVSDTKSTLRDVRRNPHLRKHRDEDERHKCPFGSGGYHNQIDKCRKQDKQDECGQRSRLKRRKQVRSHNRKTLVQMRILETGKHLGSKKSNNEIHTQQFDRLGKSFDHIIIAAIRPELNP